MHEHCFETKTFTIKSSVGDVIVRRSIGHHLVHTRLRLVTVYDLLLNSVCTLSGFGWWRGQ
jgi:hypothetical protein